MRGDLNTIADAHVVVAAAVGHNIARFAATNFQVHLQSGKETRRTRGNR